ncbi:MAG: cytochrome c maturation protein CcmE [Vicinamibacteria bacterium]|nr:cytochrome c maturation protein CcmE [Vicinamibacteria bacterium]
MIWGVLVVGIVVFLAMAINRLGRSVVYYWGPSELRSAGDQAVGASIRLGGRVVPGSVDKREKDTLMFDVSDNRSTIRVRTRATPPQMFREGIGVVVEGTLGRDGVFDGARLLVSHGNEYRQPRNGEKIDMRQLMRSTEGLETPEQGRRP